LPIGGVGWSRFMQPVAIGSNGPTSLCIFTSDVATAVGLRDAVTDRRTREAADPTHRADGKDRDPDVRGGDLAEI